jgi:hypothetical protein
MELNRLLTTSLKVSFKSNEKCSTTVCLNQVMQFGLDSVAGSYLVLLLLTKAFLSRGTI